MRYQEQLFASDCNLKNCEVKILHNHRGKMMHQLTGNLSFPQVIFLILQKFFVKRFRQ
jgi:hypothetical protein